MPVSSAALTTSAQPGGAPAGLNAAALRADERREHWQLLGLSGPALALVLLTMVLPIGWLFGLSFLADDGSLSLMHYRRMVEQPSYARIFGATFQVSLLTTGLCILLGYPLAYVLSQLPRRVANLCLIAVMLPFWTSLLVRTYAWLVLLQRRGLINTWGIELGWWDQPLPLVHNMAGTLIGMVHIMLPFLVLPVLNSMRSIDQECMKAAANLGASPTRAFWTVFLPLSLPGLFAGSLLVFVICLGFYVTPAVLGGGKIIMVSNQIANDIELFFNWGAASSLGVVLLVSTMVLLWLASRLTRLEQLLGASR
ncbi:MAG: ABC transporter permease [Rubrivivax sp.]|jgi:putative spermidine/putrescine transport system permease protein/spermidine/putrescine transport system permease protein|nr:ABC transporter permease [Rubrivivax sp.]